jgi:PIG-P
MTDFPPAADEDISSPTERCAFVLHVMTAIVAVAYTAWVLLAWFGGGTAPPPSWLTHTIPTALVGLFFAAPILYAIQNSVIVAPAHSIESLQDSVSAKQQNNLLSGPGTTNGTSGRMRQQNDQHDGTAPVDAKSAQGLPKIVDLDVGEINDLCWKSMQTTS